MFLHQRGFNWEDSLRRCAEILGNADSTEPYVQNAAHEVIDVLQNFEPRSTGQNTFQDAALDAGVVRSLARIVPQATPATQACCLLCMSELAFSNVRVKQAVFNADGLVPWLAQVLHAVARHSNDLGDLDNFEVSTRNENAFWLINALASQLWHEHDRIIETFLGDALQILNDPDQPKALASCTVRLLNLLSYNSDTTPKLVVALEPLMTIMRSGDMELGYFIAAIAVANLGACSDHSKLRINNRTIFDEFSEALECTLASRDYPNHSGNYYTPWKMCMSLSRMCGQPSNRPYVLRAGIMDVLHKGLRLRKTDREFTKHALVCVWQLTSPEPIPPEDDDPQL